MAKLVALGLARLSSVILLGEVKSVSVVLVVNALLVMIVVMCC